MKNLFILVLVIIGGYALAVAITSGVELLGMATAEMAYPPAEAPMMAIAPAETPEPTRDETADAASRHSQATTEAGEAELKRLAVEATTVAQDMLESAATQQYLVIETDNAAHFTSTAEALGRINTQLEATAQAQGMEKRARETEFFATSVALDELILTAQTEGELERSILPWRTAWDKLVLPVLLGVVPLLVGMMIVWRVWGLIEMNIKVNAIEKKRLPVVEELGEASGETPAGTSFEAAPPAAAPDVTGKLADAPKAGQQRIEVHVNGNIRRFDLPATTDQLTLLAKGLLVDKREFTHSEWAGHGKVFTRTEFDTLRQEMARRGLMKWAHVTNHGLGCEITEEGWALFKEILAASPTLDAPPPENENT